MATSLFMQAIMSLIQFGEYVSWKLPEKCHLLLTSNPDNSSYSVSSLDEAQSSRLINFNVDFDATVYSKWCDSVGMQDQLINFMLLNPEIFKNSGVNARTYTMFANALNGVKEFDSNDSLELVSLIGSGCFGANGDVVSNLFVSFVHNHLDKLISPEQIVNKDWEEVQTILKDCVYQNNEYRADIAATLTVRLTNYILYYFADKTNKDKNKTDKVVKRLSEIVLSKEKLLSEDLVYRLISELSAKYPQRITKLLAIPQISNQLLTC